MKIFKLIVNGIPSCGRARYEVVLLQQKNGVKPKDALESATTKMVFYCLVNGPRVSTCIFLWPEDMQSTAMNVLHFFRGDVKWLHVSSVGLAVYGIRSASITTNRFQLIDDWKTILDEFGT